MNETKKLHLAIGDLTDVESQDANGETTGNFGDPDQSRGLGVAIWNVQHEVWDQAVVTFEQGGTVYEVYVTPIFSEDILGVNRCFEVKLEHSIQHIGHSSNVTHTETVSYDNAVCVTLDTVAFDTAKP